MSILMQPLKESPVMETLFTTPVNKTILSYDLTTGDKLVRSAHRTVWLSYQAGTLRLQDLNSTTLRLVGRQ